jgi:hypothetical protein
VKSVEEFVQEVEGALNLYFPTCRREMLLRTSQSFKAHFHIRQNLFVAVRYNSVNGRTDVALIHAQERIFGYDNLKEWHFHPLEDPTIHIPCDEPSLNHIFREISAIIRTINTF